MQVYKGLLHQDEVAIKVFKTSSSAVTMHSLEAQTEIEVMKGEPYGMPL